MAKNAGASCVGARSGDPGALQTNLLPKLNFYRWRGLLAAQKISWYKTSCLLVNKRAAEKTQA
jgi:hypothetical protein